MAILAGIDEAGLGPTLGPLVVSGVAFRVPDEALGRCLWETLRASCTPAPRGAGRRIAVADSKLLYQARKSMAALERTALVMLAATGHKPKTWQKLLEIVAPEAVTHLSQYPWYRAVDISLPLSDGVGDVGTRANAVRRDCAARGLAMIGVFCKPLPAGHYNRLVGSTNNKAVVLLGLALRVVDRILRSTPGERVCLHVDRLGGRTHYREALMTALQGFSMEVLEESESRSAYRLVSGSRVCEIDFLTAGESRHFSVALASVYSKYLRELYMHALNRYWSDRVPGLRPTAGYYTDAKRWLGDVAEEMGRLTVDRDRLVRSR